MEQGQTVHQNRGIGETPEMGHGPYRIECVPLRVRGQLRGAGRSSGVEVGGDIAPGEGPVKGQPVGRVSGDGFVEVVDTLGLVARFTDTEYRLECRDLVPYCLHLLPDVEDRMRPESDEHPGFCGIEEIRDLVRIQKEVYGIGDPGRLRSPEGEMRLGKAGQKK